MYHRQRGAPRPPDLGAALLVGLLAIVSAMVGARPVHAQPGCTDGDQDGYFGEAACGTPRDCNDHDPSVYPGAPEACDGRDGDCNGLVDDNPACDRSCDNPELMAGSRKVTTDPLHWSLEGNVVWVGDGWVVTYRTVVNSSCSKVSLQRLDRSGNNVGSPVTVSGGQGLLVSAQEPWLAWTGSDLAVVWMEEPTSSDCSGTSGPFQAFFQRFTPSLQPLGARVRLGCAQFDPEVNPRPIWAGYQYGVVWRRGGDRVLLFSTVSRDGVPADACGVLVASPNHPESGPNNPALAWNGTYFGLSWDAARPDADFINIFNDIYFRRIGEDMSLPDASPIHVTDDPARNWRSSLVWADGEWGVSWSDERTNSWNIGEIFMARLDQAGNKLNPPGDIQITCCTQQATDPSHFWNKLEWTGEEFGLAYVEENHPAFATGDLFFQRVDRLGNKVGSRVLLTPDSAQRAIRVDMDRNGGEYGVVWDDDQNQSGFGGTYQIWFGRVGCNCVDLDADTFSTCAGGDCDDANPFVNPSALEACTDGLDNNCDAKTDCQDTGGCPAQGGPIPGEVQGLLLASDKKTLSWQAESRSDVYDLLTGDLAELRADGTFSRSRCLAWRVPGTTHADTTAPITGKGLYYLVRGKKDRCKLGTWGSVLRDQAKLTCP